MHTVWFSELLQVQFLLVLCCLKCRHCWYVHSLNQLFTSKTVYLDVDIDLYNRLGQVTHMSARSRCETIESLVRVHDTRSCCETIESGELREWRHKVKAITDAHMLVYGNDWQLQQQQQQWRRICSFPGSVGCGAVNWWRRKEKLMTGKRWWVRPSMAWLQQFGAFHMMLWWRKLKWRTPEPLQTSSGWMHSNNIIF